MATTFIWIIFLLTVLAILLRPFRLNITVWPICSCFIVLISGLILVSDALKAIVKGIDVYLFLTGMMLLAETARQEKLFDWLAAVAIKLAKGSAEKLFLFIYLAGVFVTVFLSNDATAVVLTPAVAATCKSANIKKPLPYLLICAFVANAASFVLPISNPANLVIYQGHLPSLARWLSLYSVPSIVSIFATFIILKYIQRNSLKEIIKPAIVKPILTIGAKTAFIGIGFTSVTLLLCSSNRYQLGLPTFIMGIIISTFVLIRSKKNPVNIIKGISWSIIPLVASLFILVEALTKTGAIDQLSLFLQNSATKSETSVVWISGLITAYGSNILNNLPAGLIMAQVMDSHHFSQAVMRAILIGTDLGPNLSVTGSLATILWLVMLRREGLEISGWKFFKSGVFIMSITLIFVLASLFL